jgi:hypothetical protein
MAKIQDKVINVRGTLLSDFRIWPEDEVAQKEYCNAIFV